MAKTKVRVRLTGQDGNIFNLVGLAMSELDRAGHGELSKELADSLPNCGSYNEALSLIRKYVVVS